ncbi:hypothetical protein GCM10023194_40740 [Planotetraspora phitsanulokensis]|uniref:HNH endonuclease n=1 Tax=Planotetraspora phitsanulokensis TaxID=575192 RepID=A0A8J3XLQ1_9ACTN|nr:hypothetical protein [Planotetraspora phitsanulokensis]GII40938.1 hypothetical protein Pph01_59410 [Planotetraspora phitsanulokensis]
MEKRLTIPAAAQAALWVLSNGRCYAPGCPFPVINEVRPGVFKKNAQIAHIRGVKRGAPRFRECRSEEERRERESFKNLIIVCLSHHSEIDDKKEGEKLYPPEVLHEWKRKHEGQYGAALNTIGPISEEALTEALAEAFTPPVVRLEKIADSLERTGSLNAEALQDLRQIIDVLHTAPGGVEERTAHNLMVSADTLSHLNLDNSSKVLLQASDMLSKLIPIIDARIQQLGGMM